MYEAMETTINPTFWAGKYQALSFNDNYLQNITCWFSTQMVSAHQVVINSIEAIQ